MRACGTGVPLNSAVELPVQKQLEAYNARDIDEFMRWWADDCQYFAFPSTLLARNALEIRERHIERFKEPDLHGQLLSRIVLEDMVIDHETVTRNFPEGRGEVDVVCIYEVALGKIAKAWFKIGKPRIL
ncbi:steroid delta-isomerase [Rhizobium sp. Leaf155]|nr:steroid delta-isomerase [Rhizobium sp. Leaf155]